MIPARTAIFVATERFDLRRSFDGLAGLVKEILRQDPLSGALFIFFNKAADKMKIIWWDKTGYCVLYKRLARHARLYRVRQLCRELGFPGPIVHLLCNAQCLAHFRLSDPAA